MTKKDLAALDDLANQDFLSLMYEDKAELIGSVGVDDGQIEIGACGNVQVKANTALGDGIYNVWKGKKYVVIEIDMLNQMDLDRELKPFEGKLKKKYDAAEEKARQQKIQDDFEGKTIEEEAA
jgi:hypothetical protein